MTGPYGSQALAANLMEVPESVRFDQHWKGEYRIRRDDAEADGRIRIAGLFNLLQDAASHHARELGVSIEALEARGQAWVLRGMRLALRKRPEWGNRVVVETWPAGVDRILALRDYRVWDSSGSLIAAADSSWLIIDRTTRKPVRLPREWSGFTFSQDRAFPNPPMKPERPVPPEEAVGVRAGPWDADFNGHISHIRYLDWILGALHGKGDSHLKPSVLTVQFVNEAVPGENLLVRRGPTVPVLSAGPPGYARYSLHEIVDADLGGPLVVARIDWEFEEPTFSSG